MYAEDVTLTPSLDTLDASAFQLYATTPSGAGVLIDFALASSGSDYTFTTALIPSVRYRLVYTEPKYVLIPGHNSFTP